MKLHGNESLSHAIGKEISVNILKRRKFKKYEIKLEYPIIFPTGKIRIIDVVGISVATGQKVAFEVGNLNGGLLEELYCIFDEVYQAPKILGNEKLLEECFDYFKDEIKSLKEQTKTDMENSIRDSTLINYNNIIDDEVIEDIIEKLTITSVF